VRAIDGDGNAQAYPTSYTWTIDTLAPTITTNLPSVVSSPDFDLAITSDDPNAEFECELNGDNTPCDVDFSTLTDGDDGNSLEVWAYDAAGNSGYYYKQFGYQVGASVAQITAHPARVKSSPGTSTFEFGADAGATIECSYNWDDFAPCTSPVTVQEKWFDAGYSFRVRAVKNGVTQNLPDEFDWYVGDHPFGLNWDHTPDGWTSETSAGFYVYSSYWDNNDLRYTCSLDGAAFAACDQEFHYENLSQGPHEVRVHATSKTDGGLDELSFNWQISDLPGSWFYQTPEKFTSDTSATLKWRSSDNVDIWDCKLDDGDWSPCERTYRQTVSELAEGEHTFQVRAGNEDALQNPVASYSWTVDTIVPEVTVAAPTGPIKTDPYTLPISANEPGVKIFCVLDDGPENDIFECDNGAELSGLTRGVHTITVWGYDRAYNGTDSQTYTFDWQPEVVVPPVAKPAAPIVKPTLNKPGKPKDGKFTVPYSCGDSACTLTVKIKLGKKTQSLKLTVGKGAGKAQLKLSKSQKKWLGKKGKKKATMIVTITGASGTSSQTLKF
jgi:hypothetical protein